MSRCSGAKEVEERFEGVGEAQRATLTWSATVRPTHTAIEGVKPLLESVQPPPGILVRCAQFLLLLGSSLASRLMSIARHLTSSALRWFAELSLSTFSRSC